MAYKKLTKTKILPVLAVILGMAIVISGCATEAGNGEHQDADAAPVIRGEHERESGEGEHDGESGGEESGTEYALDETYNSVRNGARLILDYNAQNNSFEGTVENTTSGTLKQVRVEVHLSNGIELGPTVPADLGPGERMNITLPASSEAFDAWTAHPETGGGESGGEHGEDGAEDGGEHSNDGEGSGEHGGNG